MKRFLSVILVLMFVFSTVVSATSQPVKDQFSDVKAHDWYYEAVNRMNQYGIITGYPNGQFLPDQKVTREEFATMMVRALKLDVRKQESSFRDVDSGYWASRYIEAAKNYLTGFKRGEDYYFQPKGFALREDLAVALVKALGKPVEEAALSELSVFADADSISKNLKTYVAAAVKFDLMQGYEQDGKRYLGPAKPITRAEAATLLLSVIDLEKITFGEEEKVVLNLPEGTEKEEDGNDKTPDGQFVFVDQGPSVTAEVINNKLRISWFEVPTDGLRGYKIVFSKTNQRPSYPADGYAEWITDLSTRSIEISGGSDYHGGDLNKIEAGQKYYVSVTALYQKGKRIGNAVKVTMP